MAVYGPFADQPNRITDDGREITIKLDRVQPDTAVITWNLPKGNPGCSPEDLAYNGIVIVLDTVEILQAQTPKNGLRYVGDPTADSNLFAGDKISTGLVIGAFYNNKTTVSLTVTGLTPNVPYYIAGFAVDNVLRYHNEGVHTYSLTFGDSGTASSPGCQIICLNVQPTDLTGLQSGITYELPLSINAPLRQDSPWVANNVNNVCATTQPIQPTNIILFDGADALTWQALVDELNHQFALLSNPTIGFTPPNSGSYYFNLTTRKLYQWTGYVLIELSYISDPNPPTMPNLGDYWVNTTNSALYIWNGIVWVIQQIITLGSDPTDMPCETVWFDGTTAYLWDGTVWIPLTTFIQENDPEAAPILTCGSYWFNPDTGILYKWTDITGSCPAGNGLANGCWKPVSPILWPDDPTVVIIGDYWFNLLNNKVNTWNGASWNIVTTAVVAELPPLLPMVNQLWYKPSNEELSQWNGSIWVIVPVKVWDKDPQNPPAGSVWWNTTTDTLFERDVLTNTWVPVTTFYDQVIDPSLPLNFAPNQYAWFNPTTGVLQLWDGSQWVVQDPFITYPTDPTIIVDGIFWHNTTTDTWYIRSGGVWVTINPILHPTEPTMPTAGEYWIDSSNQLYIWNGMGWILLSYTTSSPQPAIGTQWYDSTNNVLMEWNGSTWVPAIPTAIATLFPLGTGAATVYDLRICTGNVGAQANIFVVPPAQPFPTTQPFYIFDGNQLLITVTLAVPFAGVDGVSAYPMYDVMGIGTDGTSDERRDIIHKILSYFGSPSVQVELTKDDLNQCLDLSLRELRRLSSSTYQRKFFFLTMQANKQRYLLTDINQKFNTIHRVLGVNRRTSAFAGQAAGQGVYGQLVLQHLYQMGTFDLVSYHIISDYSKMMEIMFATRVMYLWDEKTRALDIFQTFNQPEIVIVDCACERTEQDIFADRFLYSWLLNWSLSLANIKLANIRGKFQTLPGAGGGIALNASDLRADADKLQTRCLSELEDWVVNSNIEEYGMQTQFCIG